MKNSILTLVLIFNILGMIGCESAYDVEEGLSYEEYINRAVQNLNKGEVDRSIALYRKALTIKPEDAKTHYILGDLYYREWRRSYESAQHKAQYKLLMKQNRKNIGDITKELEKYPTFR